MPKLRFLALPFHVLSSFCVLGMVTGNPPMIGSGGDGFGGEDLGFLLREQKGRDRERELSIGSAPPTVEGSLTAMGGISGRQVASGISDLPAVKNGNGFSTGQELLSNPAYVSYHH